MTPTDGIKLNKATTPPISFGFSKKTETSDSAKAGKELGNHFSSFGGITDTDYPGLSISKSKPVAQVKTDEAKTTDGMPDVNKYVSPESKARIEASMADFEKHVATNQAGATNVINSDFGSKFSDKTKQTIGALSANLAV